MLQFERIAKEVQKFNSINGSTSKFDCFPQVQNSFVRSLVSKTNWIAVVDDSFLNDSFNFYGLPSKVQDYHLGLKVLKEDIFDTSSGKTHEQLFHIAYQLYALIHARFILTTPGLEIMKRKFESGIFGVCPRFCCDNQELLPAGLSSEPGHSNVIAYCPRCQDIYTTDVDLDGSFFGPAFPHFFQQKNRETFKLKYKSQYPLLNYNGISLDPKGSVSPKRLFRQSEIV